MSIRYKNKIEAKDAAKKVSSAACKRYAEKNKEKLKIYQREWRKKRYTILKNDNVFIEKRNIYANKSYHNRKIIKNAERRKKTSDLDDWYIIKKLRDYIGLSTETILNNSSLIEYQKLILKFKRQIKNEKRNNNHVSTDTRLIGGI